MCLETDAYTVVAIIAINVYIHCVHMFITL